MSVRKADGAYNVYQFQALHTAVMQSHTAHYTLTRRRA